MPKKNKFIRNFKKNSIETLKKEVIFKDYLKPDIDKGKVFPAIRNEYIDFYFNGGRIFKYEKDFETHIKYASVFKSKSDYIIEDDLKEIGIIKNFAEGYENIKKNCSLYSGDEAKGVSEIYNEFSCAKKINSDIVVIDIEIALSSNNEFTEDKKRNRIDLLLYNQKERKLRFIEAKTFSNSEIWSSKSNPKVLEQIQRYEEQLEKRENEIIEAYSNYVGIINELFDLNIEKPDKLDKHAALLIFGFDRDQSQGRLTYLKKSLKSTKYYPIGNVKSIKVITLWEKTQK